ncbi:hypothetical protein BBOV_I002680 [Babesia bovis T2Bo]|uniref:Uncharacterized protein n=1 Tax=Babesia bovis TaxID=5865 RepID=A7AWC2_BABBO|nr:hypothetical protein BBOV_I002680 [Babesia bovis T2Bo]EDO05350.1 hypothetical protein BBOV_I002680 [Babesia bovis T2Bo]|eukprot:XP_001608918.1 hypothetical protein [Babesia bovis T2Bo]
MEGKPAGGDGVIPDDASQDSQVNMTEEENNMDQMMIKSIGIDRFCSADASHDTILTTMYDTGESSYGKGYFLQPLAEDVDCTMGIPMCNDVILMRHHEKYHCESAIPSLFTHFLECGTAVRYVHDFSIYTPTCDRMVPLDQLGRLFQTMVLVGKVKLVSTVMDDDQIQKEIQQLLVNGVSPDHVRVKQGKKSKTIGVRITIVDFFFDHGTEIADIPALYVVSEHDIYYRLDKVAARYLANFETFIVVFNLAASMAKAYQRNRNCALNDVVTDAAAADNPALNIWGDPLHIPGFTEVDVYKTIEVLYKECLYQHIFLQPCRTAVEDIRMGIFPESAFITGDIDGIMARDVSGSLESPSSHMSSEILSPFPQMTADTMVQSGSFGHGDHTVNVKNAKYIDSGVLMMDILETMRDHQPLYFFDEEFVLPEHSTAYSLIEKYNNAVYPSFVSADGMPMKRPWFGGFYRQYEPDVMPVTWMEPAEVTKPTKPTKAQKTQNAQKGPKALKGAKASEGTSPPGSPQLPEIKSKVSGRIIKRTTKLTEPEDRARPSAEDQSGSSKRANTTAVVDEATLRKQKMLIEKEKMCNALLLPVDFDYCAYNTTSELSGDEAGNDPVALLNDFELELKDARYYPRDLPLRTLRFYGADDLLDIAFVCRNFSTSSSVMEPALPKFTFEELERNLLHATSVDLYKPLDPSTFVFGKPDCLCLLLKQENGCFSKLGKIQAKLEGLHVGIIRPLLDYCRFEGFEFRLMLLREQCDIPDRKRDNFEKEIIAAVQDTETLVHFLTTHGGCLYRGRFKSTLPESYSPMPYINGIRWNKRFKQVERLLSALKSHKYTNAGHEYRQDAVVIKLDKRLASVPIDIMIEGRKRLTEYSAIYPSNVFEVLPTFNRKFKIWPPEIPTRKEAEPSKIINKLNQKLDGYLRSAFFVEQITKAPEVEIEYGFQEPLGLLKADIVMRPEMITSFTWAFLLRIYLFYAFYTCRHKYVFKLNTTTGGEMPQSGINSIDEEDDEDDDFPTENPLKNKLMDFTTDIEKGAQIKRRRGTKRERIASSDFEDEDDEEEDEGDDEDDVYQEDVDEVGRMNRRRGWGNNRYSPYYDFELDWYPDEERIKHMFQGAIAADAMKIIFEKMRKVSFYELEARDRLLLLRWLGELLTSRANAKRYVDQRNDEFYALKLLITKADGVQNPSNANSEAQGDDSERGEGDDTSGATGKNDSEDVNTPRDKPNKKNGTSTANTIQVKTEDHNGHDPASETIVKTDEQESKQNGANTATANPKAVKVENDIKDGDDNSTDDADSNVKTADVSQNPLVSDMTRKKKPREIMRDLAELEERYMQTNYHLGRDRFYNDYYYFGSDLGCRIYVRTLPSIRFTAQRVALRSKQLRTPSFTADKFKFNINDYAKQLEENRVFETDGKRGRHKRSDGKDSGPDVKDMDQSLNKDGSVANTPRGNGEETNAPAAKDESNPQMVKRKKQKGRKPKITKPYLRRSREFFDRQPTDFANVQEYIKYLINIPPRLCWAVMDNPKEVRMFIERLSPMTTNERALQAKLSMMEVEMKRLSVVETERIECWKAPTIQGQVLTTLLCGLEAFIPKILGMLGSTLMRYNSLSKIPCGMENNNDEKKNACQENGVGDVNANTVPFVRSTEDKQGQNDKYADSQVAVRIGSHLYRGIINANEMLMQFINTSVRQMLAGCCGNMMGVASQVMTVMEIIILIESLLHLYCDSETWARNRFGWQQQIELLYQELIEHFPDVGDGYSFKGNCECMIRLAGTALKQQERILVRIVEEIGIWFHYVYIFNMDRINLLQRYRLSFNSAIDIQRPTLICQYLSNLDQQSVVYLFGGYREWLLSLYRNDAFPRDLFDEMLREYLGDELGEDDVVLEILENVEPKVPMETLEGYIESVWFFEVPGFGKIARCVIRSVEYDIDINGVSKEVEEGHLVPYLQHLDDTTRDEDDDPEQWDRPPRGNARKSQNFVVYAPLDSVDRECEFILPMEFVKKYLSHTWRHSMQCMWRGEKAQVIRVCYGLADIWHMLEIDTDNGIHMVNLWDVTPV